MRKRTVLGVTGGVVLVGLIGVGWSAGYALGRPAPAATTTSAIAPESAVVVRTPSPVSTPTPTRTSSVAAAKAPARTCSIASAARDARLANFQGRVVNARTKEVLFDRKGSKASRTASVLKVLTTAAALDVLGPDHRLKTRVVAGKRSGEIVLVGGGDVTLSRTPAGSTTAYAGAAHLSTLAKQVKKAWAADPAHKGEKIRRIVLDSSYFGGPSWQPSWETKERVDGYMPKITALMVDGDRADPYATVSYRSTDPIGRAGAAFATYFGGSVKVSRGIAPSGAKQLGVVRSQPVSTLVKQTLIVSDNTIAEALARETAIVGGAGNRFTSEQAGTVGGLQAYGVDTTALKVVDGSGLSDDNRVPPKYLTSLFIKILHKDQHLASLFDGLPIAGRTGSLSYSDRFEGAASRADGHVHAKTGWIDTGYTLAGTIRAKDRTPLTFAFYALGDVTESAKQALDELTADAWSCGNRLSNH